MSSTSMSAYLAIAAAVIAQSCSEAPASTEEESFLKQRQKVMVRLSELAEVISTVDNPDPLGPSAPLSKVGVDIGATAINAHKATDTLPHVAPDRLGVCAADTLKFAVDLDAAVRPIIDVVATIMAAAEAEPPPSDEDHPRYAESYQRLGNILTTYRQGHDRIVSAMCSLIRLNRECQKVAKQLGAKAYVSDWVDASALHPFSTSSCALSR